jgi:hypothetical protein
MRVVVSQMSSLLPGASASAHTRPHARAHTTTHTASQLTAPGSTVTIEVKYRGVLQVTGFQPSEQQPYPDLIEVGREAAESSRSLRVCVPDGWLQANTIVKRLKAQPKISFVVVVVISAREGTLRVVKTAAMPQKVSQA